MGVQGKGEGEECAGEEIVIRGEECGDGRVDEKCQICIIGLGGWLQFCRLIIEDSRHTGWGAVIKENIQSLAHLTSPFVATKPYDVDLQSLSPTFKYCTRNIIRSDARVGTSAKIP